MVENRLIKKSWTADCSEKMPKTGLKTVQKTKQKTGQKRMIRKAAKKNIYNFYEN